MSRQFRLGAPELARMTGTPSPRPAHQMCNMPRPMKRIKSTTDSQTEPEHKHYRDRCGKHYAVEQRKARAPSLASAKSSRTVQFDSQHTPRSGIHCGVHQSSRDGQAMFIEASCRCVLRIQCCECIRSKLLLESSYIMARLQWPTG